MIKFTNNANTNDTTRINETCSKYTLIAGISASILLFAAVSEAAEPGSVGIIQQVIKNITTLIKTDGKVGLQILSAAAGSVAAAKTVSWQPLVVGAGGAGILEMIFQAIG
jgi:hypothetical protein